MESRWTWEVGDSDPREPIPDLANKISEFEGDFTYAGCYDK